MLVDEIIKIEIKLNDVVSIPRDHRKFAFLGTLNGTDKVIISKDNYQDIIANITDAMTKNFIQIWFTNSGTSLTIYNVPSDYDISAITIDEKNILLAGYPLDNQKTIYNSLTTDYKTSKNIYFAIEKADDISFAANARNIFVLLVEGADYNKYNYIFEYFAPYTQNDYYKQNSFLSSSIAGVKLNSLDFLKQNNIGALVYFPEFNQNNYFNIGDKAGYNFNLDILKDDLSTSIKENMFNSLKQNNKYTQSNISTLEFCMKKAGDYYKSLNLINSFTTSSTSYAQQLETDIKNGIVKGFNLQYQIISEVKEADVILQEAI
ncbi:hypothetical protein ACFX5K_00090 [Rickettsiales bacterium LUAb2]